MLEEGHTAKVSGPVVTPNDEKEATLHLSAPLPLQVTPTSSLYCFMLPWASISISSFMGRGAMGDIPAFLTRLTSLSSRDVSTSVGSLQLLSSLGVLEVGVAGLDHAPLNKSYRYVFITSSLECEGHFCLLSSPLGH